MVNCGYKNMYQTSYPELSVIQTFLITAVQLTEQFVDNLAKFPTLSGRRLLISRGVATTPAVSSANATQSFFSPMYTTRTSSFMRRWRIYYIDLCIHIYDMVLGHVDADA
jgi:hypothetical protein